MNLSQRPHNSFAKMMQVVEATFQPPREVLVSQKMLGVTLEIMSTSLSTPARERGDDGELDYSHNFRYGPQPMVNVVSQVIAKWEPEPLTERELLALVRVPRTSHKRITYMLAPIAEGRITGPLIHEFQRRVLRQAIQDLEHMSDIHQDRTTLRYLEHEQTPA